MEVQTSQRNALLQQLVDIAKKYYLDHHNPLGLVDDTILEIQNSREFPFEAFDEFYHDLSTVYRFKHGEVQLEFLFDGTSHDEKYTNEWGEYFRQSVRAFCSSKLFMRAVLDIAVFHRHDYVAQRAGVRLKYFLSNYFDLKVYKYRGVMEIAS